MPGIAEDTLEQVRAKIARFDRRYVVDWENWLRRTPTSAAENFGKILRKWQACRPNAMRRTKAHAEHSPPHLEDLLQAAYNNIQLLSAFDMSDSKTFTTDACEALSSLWKIFEGLSHMGKSRGGQTGVVGISKAVLLLTDGGVGPAFDSRVRANLQLQSLDDQGIWLAAIKSAAGDIQAFETRQGVKLREIVPNFSHLKTGRLYDMALGPGA